MALDTNGAGKVFLFVRSTGQRVEHWPVDAKELLATGAYSIEAPSDFVAPPVTPPPPALNTTAPTQTHPLGVPAVTTHASVAAPAQPAGEPVRTSSRTTKRDKAL